VGEPFGIETHDIAVNMGGRTAALEG